MARRRPAFPLAFAAALLLLALLLPSTLGQQPHTWDASCPEKCKCIWLSGSKGAECTARELTSIPLGFSPEIQILDLDRNPIRSLGEEAFKGVGLVNLHKIKLRECRIDYLDPRAFRDLEILIELDLSNNNIRSLDPQLFRGLVKLRVVLLNKNPITELSDGLFLNLQHLQKVEFKECQLRHVAPNTFRDVPKLQHVILSQNNLTTMEVGSLVHLNKLNNLALDGNPWICDCHLWPFLNWTVHRNLYVLPTSCDKPEKLRERNWYDLTASDLACRPHITDLFPSKGGIVADQEDVTLSCRAEGQPPPQLQWVHNNRVLSNESRRHYGAKFLVATHSQWVNLTIPKARRADSGTYMCVVESNGGIDERNYTLDVSDSGAGLLGGGMGGHDALPLILGLVCSAVFIILVLLVLLFVCTLRRRQAARAGKKHAAACKSQEMSNGPSPQDPAYPDAASEQGKSLLANPVEKPPRRIEMQPLVSGTATELPHSKGSLLEGSVFVAGGGDSVGPSRSTERTLDSSEQLDTTFPPDLLAFPARGSQASPAGSTASTAPDHTRLPQHLVAAPQSPPLLYPQRCGTLPLSRSHSPFSVTGVPIVTPRQGYVTIPRRPRVPSWSSPPTNTEHPLSPKSYDPVYDNLGPRTTVDGSSVLSLNKPEPQQPLFKPRPLPHTPSLQYFQPLDDLDPLHSPPPAPAPEHPIVSPRASWASPRASLVSPTGSLGRNSAGKVPPKPPPKPKKKLQAGPLFEDEGEDGTEV